MRKLKEVMRLRFELHLGYQQIGRSCAIGVSTVHKYLKRAEAAGLTWPLPADWDEARVEAAVFPPSEPPAGQTQLLRSQPDFAAMHEQLRRHRHLTLQLLWEEYHEANPDGYRYSRFCELYQRWRSKLDVVLRQEHKSGREDLRRLGGLDPSSLRPTHGPSLAGAVVRSDARGEFLYLGRGHARSADGIVAACARARV